MKFLLEQYIKLNRFKDLNFHNLTKERVGDIEPQIHLSVYAPAMPSGLALQPQAFPLDSQTFQCAVEM